MLGTTRARRPYWRPPTKRLPSTRSTPRTWRSPWPRPSWINRLGRWTSKPAFEAPGFTRFTTPAHSPRIAHAESVIGVSNLRIADFTCRFLVVQDLWIPLAESLLISHFSPIWNRMVDGFGTRDPGTGRYSGYCPRWDVLHPGRAWAARCRPRPETAADITREVSVYLRGATSPSFETFSGNPPSK